MKLFGPLFLLVSVAAMVSAAEPAPAQGEYYRAYEPEKEAPAVRARLPKLEKALGIVDAPKAITAPDWREYPRPFTFDMRRAHPGLWIQVLLLIDANGTVKRCVVLSATDEQVAREAGSALAHAPYKPALMDGNPVASAAIVKVEGGGI